MQRYGSPFHVHHFHRGNTAQSHFLELQNYIHCNIYFLVTMISRCIISFPDHHLSFRGVWQWYSWVSELKMQIVLETNYKSWNIGHQRVFLWKRRRSNIMIRWGELIRLNWRDCCALLEGWVEGQKGRGDGYKWVGVGGVFWRCSSPVKR
jgi:hypothetical protein